MVRNQGIDWIARPEFSGLGFCFLILLSDFMSDRIKTLLVAPTDAVMAGPENATQMGHHKSSDLLIFACPINTFPVKR